MDFSTKVISDRFVFPRKIFSNATMTYSAKKTNKNFSKFILCFSFLSFFLPMILMTIFYSRFVVVVVTVSLSSLLFYQSLAFRSILFCNFLLKIINVRNEKWNTSFGASLIKFRVRNTFSPRRKAHTTMTTTTTGASDICVCCGPKCPASAHADTKLIPRDSPFRHNSYRTSFHAPQKQFWNSQQCLLPKCGEKF